MTNNKKDLLKRYLIFLAGLFVNSLGVALITKANLGTSPISSIPYVLSLNFALSLGNFTIIFSILLIVLQIVILGKNFKPESLLQIPVSIAFGFFIDFSMILLNALNPQMYAAKVAYMFITYILWGSIFYTSVNIPYGSMASVISSEPKDRSSLSVFRSLGGTLAGILIGMLAPMVVYYTDEAGNKVVSASKISMIAGIFSVLAVICYLLCYTLTTERVAYVPKPDVQKKTFGQTVSALFSSRSLMGLILSAVLLLLASLMSQGINQYLFADYFKNTAALSVYSLLMLPCVLVLSAVSTKLAVKYGKKECSLIGMFISARTLSMTWK